MPESGLLYIVLYILRSPPSVVRRLSSVVGGGVRNQIFWTLVLSNCCTYRLEIWYAGSRPSPIEQVCVFFLIGSKMADWRPFCMPKSHFLVYLAGNFRHHRCHRSDLLHKYVPILGLQVCQKTRSSDLKWPTGGHVCHPQNSKKWHIFSKKSIYLGNGKEYGIIMYYASIGNHPWGVQMHWPFWPPVGLNPQIWGVKNRKCSDFTQNDFFGRFRRFPEKNVLGQKILTEIFR